MVTSMFLARADGALVFAASLVYMVFPLAYAHSLEAWLLVLSSCGLVAFPGPGDGRAIGAPGVLYVVSSSTCLAAFVGRGPAAHRSVLVASGRTALVRLSCCGEELLQFARMPARALDLRFWFVPPACSGSGASGF